MDGPLKWDPHHWTVSFFLSLSPVLSTPVIDFFSDGVDNRKWWGTVCPEVELHNSRCWGQILAVFRPISGPSSRILEKPQIPLIGQPLKFLLCFAFEDSQNIFIIMSFLASGAEGPQALLMLMHVSAGPAESPIFKGRGIGRREGELGGEKGKEGVWLCSKYEPPGHWAGLKDVHYVVFSPQVLKDHKHYVQGVSWDPRDFYIATHSSDRTCRLYATSNQKTLFNIQRNTMSYEKDGKLVKNKYSRMFMDETMQSFFRRCAFSPDGSYLFLPAGLCDPSIIYEDYTVGSGHRIPLYINTGQYYGRIRPHPCSPNCAISSPFTLIRQSKP